MDTYDYLDTDNEPEHPFAVLSRFMRLFYGSLFWPIVILNTIGWAWCAYEGTQGLRDGLSLLWRALAPTL